MMEEQGIVGPGEGSRPRQVLVGSVEQVFGSGETEPVDVPQGDVYDEKPPAVLDEMRNSVREIEKNENHPWHKLLNDLTHDAFKPLF